MHRVDGEPPTAAKTCHPSRRSARIFLGACGAIGRDRRDERQRQRAHPEGGPVDQEGGAGTGERDDHPGDGRPSGLGDRRGDRELRDRCVAAEQESSRRDLQRGPSRVGAERRQHVPERAAPESCCKLVSGGSWLIPWRLITAVC